MSNKTSIRTIGVDVHGGGPGGDQEGERLLQGAQIEEPGQDRPVAWKILW
jgi:hypothetical protein